MIGFKQLTVLSSLLLASSLSISAYANVSVFKHCGYKGYKVNLAPGNYDLKDLEARGIRNDDLSSLSVPRGYKITVYQHHHFTGKSKTFYSNDSCLVNNKFNDIISSIKVRRAPLLASVYQHCNFRGYSANLLPGRYNLAALKRLDVKNDDLSAIKVPRGYEVIAYQHDNFRGKRITLRQNDACLVNNKFNDVISSIIVRRIPASVSVYQHCNFGGYSAKLQPGNYNLARLKRMGVRNDDLSAIKVPKGRSVTVFEHDHFQGRRITFRGNDSCLVNNQFNDIISSIMVR